MIGTGHLEILMMLLFSTVCSWLDQPVPFVRLYQSTDFIPSCVCIVLDWRACNKVVHFICKTTFKLLLILPTFSNFDHTDRHKNMVNIKKKEEFIGETIFLCLQLLLCHLFSLLVYLLNRLDFPLYVNMT